MPKVRDCEYTHGGAEFRAALRVDSRGTFKITRPGAAKDWAGVGVEIQGTEAEKVEAAWKQAVRDFVERTGSERKVLVVKFDSSLRPGGARDFFLRGDTLLYLSAAVALERTVRQGETVTVSYVPHPDCYGFGKEEPFPSWMDLDLRGVDRDGVVVVPWTVELEAAVVRAAAGIQAVVDLLDTVFSDPDAFKEKASRLAALPMAGALGPGDPPPATEQSKG